ncbi:hypothetical protein WJX74_009723 [Apatococcus lobatus]|uniref:type I protein arginine methyltransferase n=1 Tax=Apatococcus lobatus TaxID=904363 RepID=A0AAW1QYQ2_9CHLO
MPQPLDVEIQPLCLAELGSSAVDLAWGGQEVVLSLKSDGERTALSLRRVAGGITLLSCTLAADTVWQANERLFFVKRLREHGSNTESIALKCPSAEVASELSKALQQHNSALEAAEDDFAKKTDKGSSDLYFYYYGMLQHQQNMLQDYIRTGTYWSAILENAPDFQGKVVMDVGAGSGILSLFAAQAGARKVYAVEASAMADFAKLLASTNAEVGSRVEVVKGRVEEISLPEPVDVLVSEPMGTLLVNERMLETYLFARDRFLVKSGGKMFPRLGRVYACAFSDETLHAELINKAAFWLQPSFYGVDITHLYQPALSGYFGQVVVDAIDPSVLVSACASRQFDFLEMQEQELHNIVIPLDLEVACDCRVHGLACWFDVLFDGSVQPRWLTTAPGQPTTHWFQLRCVLEQPLAVRAGDHVTGRMELQSHNRQSYDIILSLTAPPFGQGEPEQQATGKMDLKEPYYRQLNGWWPQPASQDEQGVAAGSHSQQDGAATSPASDLLHSQLPADTISQALGTSLLHDMAYLQQLQQQQQPPGWL